MPSHDDTTLYDVLISENQICGDELQRVLAGRELASLDLLMRGGPPAYGTITINFGLWSDSLEGNRDLGEDVLIHLLIARTGLPTLAGLRDLHAVMHPHERKRLDYWLAMHGDKDAASGLYESYHAKPDIRAAFAAGLKNHT